MWDWGATIRSSNHSRSGGRRSRFPELEHAHLESVPSGGQYWFDNINVVVHRRQAASCSCEMKNGWVPRFPSRRFGRIDSGHGGLVQKVRWSAHLNQPSSSRPFFIFSRAQARPLNYYSTLHSVDSPRCNGANSIRKTIVMLGCPGRGK